MTQTSDLEKLIGQEGFYVFNGISTSLGPLKKIEDKGKMIELQFDQSHFFISLDSISDSEIQCGLHIGQHNITI